MKLPISKADMLRLQNLGEMPDVLTYATPVDGDKFQTILDSINVERALKMPIEVSDLVQLKVGDIVQVTLDDGSTHLFRVREYSPNKSVCALDWIMESQPRDA